MTEAETRYAQIEKELLSVLYLLLKDSTPTPMA